MPIVPPKPNRGLDGLLKKVIHLLKLYGFDLMEGGIDYLRYPLYVLSPDSIGKGSLQETSKLVGWRFLLSQGSLHAAIDFEQAEKGKYRLHSISTEGYIDTLRSTIDELAKRRSYRVSELTVPGINVWALWMQPTQAKRPEALRLLVAPMQEFDLGKTYNPRQFLGIAGYIVGNQGTTQLVAPASLEPQVDTARTYLLSCKALGEAVFLDGVGGGMRPAMRDGNGSELQLWRFAYVDQGYYRLHCVGIGEGCALEGGAKDMGALMNGTANQSGQVWRIIDAGGGYVHLANMFTASDFYALDGGAKDGGALISPTGKASQFWKLTAL